MATTPQKPVDKNTDHPPPAPTKAAPKATPPDMETVADEQRRRSDELEADKRANAPVTIPHTPSTPGAHASTPSKS
jgi:hypothetical protein